MALLKLFPKQTPRRIYSTGCCYVMSQDGVIALPRHKWQHADTYFEAKPMWTRVGQLCYMNPRAPYSMVSPSMRDFLGSGVSVAFNAQQSGMCLSNPYVKDNVGVLRGSNIIAFKELEFDECLPWSSNTHQSFKDWATFLLGVCEEVYGSDYLSKMPEDMQGYIHDLNDVHTEEDANFVLNHATHLSDISFAELVTEISSMLNERGQLFADYEQFPVDHLKLVTAIGVKYSMHLQECFQHPVVKGWVPNVIQNQLEQCCLDQQALNRLMSNDYLAGVLLLNVLRNGCVLAVGAHSLELINSLFPNRIVRRSEILEMLRHLYPSALKDILAVFKRHYPKSWMDILEMHSRNPKRYM